MEAIHWPKEFTPGFTDNFVSAETYVAGLTAEEVFPYLTHAHIWADYYDGVSDVKLSGSDEKPELKEGTKFSFNIIGWDVTAEVVEFVEPSKGKGALSKVLTILTFYDINLTMLQSMPVVGHEWEYRFYKRQCWT